MVTSSVVGVICVAAFCFLQSFVSVYRSRLVSRRRAAWYCCMRA